MNLANTFEKYHDNYLKFDKSVAHKSSRPDLCAFMLLAELVPSDMDIIGAAEHDEIYLNVDCDTLAAVITEDQVDYLVRCGVMFSSQNDSLFMFV